MQHTVKTNKLFFGSWADLEYFFPFFGWEGVGGRGWGAGGWGGGGGLRFSQHSVKTKELFLSLFFFFFLFF